MFILWFVPWFAQKIATRIVKSYTTMLYKKQ